MPGAYTNHSSSSSFCRASCLLFHILCSVVQLKCASLKTVLFFAKEDAEDEPACLYVVVIRYNSYAHSAGFIVVGLKAEKNALKRQKWRKKHEPSNYSTKETLFSILACPVRSLVLYKERGGERGREKQDWRRRRLCLSIELYVCPFHFSSSRHSRLVNFETIIYKVLRTEGTSQSPSSPPDGLWV